MHVDSDAVWIKSRSIKEERSDERTHVEWCKLEIRQEKQTQVEEPNAWTTSLPPMQELASFPSSHCPFNQHFNSQYSTYQFLFSGLTHNTFQNHTMKVRKIRVFYLNGEEASVISGTRNQRSKFHFVCFEAYEGLDARLKLDSVSAKERLTHVFIFKGSSAIF